MIGLVLSNINHVSLQLYYEEAERSKGVSLSVPVSDFEQLKDELTSMIGEPTVKETSSIIFIWQNLSFENVFDLIGYLGI